MSNRWERTAAPRGDDYDARWRSLADAGHNIHGEADLVESLLAAVEGTDAGAADKTSEAQRLEIARLASSLKKYRMRNPAQSPLLWGRYRVSYCR